MQGENKNYRQVGKSTVGIATLRTSQRSQTLKNDASFLTMGELPTRLVMIVATIMNMPVTGAPVAAWRVFFEWARYRAPIMFRRIGTWCPIFAEAKIGLCAVPSRSDVQIATAICISLFRVHTRFFRVHA